MLRPFVKGLSQKLWTGSSKLNDSRSAARYSYGRYASSTLHLMSILVTLAVSHGCQQAWCHHRPSSWQGLSDRPTRMLTTGFSDGRVKLSNARLQLLKQCDERGYFQDIGIQQHRILYSGDSRAHLFRPSRRFLRSAPMLTKKRFQCLALRLLQLLQFGPPSQQIENRGRSDIVKPVQHLWEVDLQARGEPVAMSLLLLHPMPALFHQHQQSTKRASPCGARRRIRSGGRLEARLQGDQCVR